MFSRHDSVWNRKIYFEIITLLNFEQGTSQLESQEWKIQMKTKTQQTYLSY